MRKGIERIIYSNYDLWTEENVEIAKETLMENNEGLEEEDITKNDIWDELYYEDDTNWEYEKENLESGLKNPYGYLVCGTLGLWYGKCDGGQYYKDFDDMISRNGGLFKDCDYIKIYDVDGHLYMQGTHHDGTDCYEVKELTNGGQDLLDRWNYYEYGNDKDEREIHEMLWNNNLYTRLPHFVHRIYGCPKKESMKKSEVA